MPEKIVRWSLFALILIRCVFLAIPDGLYIYPFPFSALGMPITSYTWVIAEHIALIWIVHRWWRDSKRHTALIFLYMCVLDFADFVLHANSPWFYTMGYPITANVFTAICFMLLTLNLDE